MYHQLSNLCWFTDEKRRDSVAKNSIVKIVYGSIESFVSVAMIFHELFKLRGFSSNYGKVFIGAEGSPTSEGQVHILIRKSAYRQNNLAK